ncbi:MAG: hypothetical protein D6678_02205 [Zetaproteobacteria bacterium]|nr:MAG: hypothetical protein D6678_02205 [Zetaproteobacteria bacterium]
MEQVQKQIEDYLDAVEQVHGPEARNKLRVRWTGGTQVVLHHLSNGARRLVDLGSLRLMARQLRRQAA